MDIKNFIFLAIDTTLSSKWLMWGLFLCALSLTYVIGIRIFVRLRRQTNIKKTLIRKIQNVKKSFFSKQKKQNFFLIGNKENLIKKIFNAYTSLHLSLSWNFVLIIFFGSVLFLFLLCFGIVKSFFLSLVLTALGCIFVISYLFVKSTKQRKKIIEQMPTFLRALGNALEAGYSLPQAFLFVGQEIHDPLKTEMKIIAQKLNFNISLESALFDFAQKTKHKDIIFFAESVRLQKQTGGNLIQLFKKLSVLIEERIKLQRDIQSFTSQGKVSGILVASLWPISLLLFSIISPAHIDILFNTETGKILLAIAIMLEIIGFLIIWKIITVEF